MSLFSDYEAGSRPAKRSCDRILPGAQANSTCGRGNYIFVKQIRGHSLVAGRLLAKEQARVRFSLTALGVKKGLSTGRSVDIRNIHLFRSEGPYRRPFKEPLSLIVWINVGTCV